jgi:hypothetical protein
MMRDIAARAVAAIELLPPPLQEAPELEWLDPPAGSGLCLSHRERKEIGNRAFVNDEGTIHVALAELEFGIKKHRPLRCRSGKSYGDRLSRTIAEPQRRSACGGYSQIAAPKQTRQNKPKQPVHRTLLTLNVHDLDPDPSRPQAEANNSDVVSSMQHPSIHPNSLN